METSGVLELDMAITTGGRAGPSLQSSLRSGSNLRRSIVYVHCRVMGMQKHSPFALLMQQAHSPGGHFAEVSIHLPRSCPVNPCARQSSTQISLPSAFGEDPLTRPTAAAPIPVKNNRKA